MTRYHARWVCPVSAPPIRDGTVVEGQGRIAYVGPREHAPRGGDDVDLGDAILLPGLVNAHCHLELTAMRGFLEGLGFREWIIRLATARREVLTADMLADAARLGVQEGLLGGVTTFADTGDSDAAFDAMLENGVRGIAFREVFGPHPAQCEASIADLERKVTTMLARATPLVHVGLSPHAPYTVSDDLFRAVAALSRRLGVPVAVHVAESAIETELVAHGAGEFADALRRRDIPVEPRGRTPIGLLERVGILDLGALLIHCVRVDAADIALLAEHACSVAHCPASNARLGHGIAPLDALLGARVRVGLGSDSVASNDRMDILDEARVASLLASAREGSPSALSAASALHLATLGGAQALGLAERIGSLEVGKDADLAAFPLASRRTPVHDPAGALVFAMAGAAASLVAVRGEVLVRDGAIVRADRALAGRVQHSADLLRNWLSAR